MVVDIPDIWGILLSRKWAAILGGTLQMGLSYATVIIGDEAHVFQYNQPMTRDHVEEIRTHLEDDGPLEDHLRNSSIPLFTFTWMIFLSLKRMILII